MKTLKQTLLASAGVVMLAGSASAADLPLRAGPAPMAIPYANWTGPYIGGHIGVGSLHSTCDSVGDYNCAGSETPGALNGHDTSFVFGAQAGYDWQDRYFVYGVVADWSWTNMKSSTRGHSGSSTWESKVNWLASFRGRAGLAVDDTLLYVTGGVAIGDFKNTTRIGKDPADPSPGTFGETRVGWVAGVGAEHKFGRNWSVMAEYLHYDFGKWDNTDTTSSYTYTHQFTGVVDVARVGLNYRW